MKEWSTLREIFAQRSYRAWFFAFVILIGGVYSIALPFSYTQRFSLLNWHYLNLRLALFSTLFGIVMALVVTLQIYAMRALVSNRGSASGLVAILASLLPSLTCCSPIVPTLLSGIGLSAMGLASTSGSIQYFFASHENEFLWVSVAMLIVNLVWSLRKISVSQCLAETRCVTLPSVGQKHG